METFGSPLVGQKRLLFVLPKEFVPFVFKWSSTSGDTFQWRFSLRYWWHSVVTLCAQENNRCLIYKYQTEGVSDTGAQNTSHCQGAQNMAVCHAGITGTTGKYPDWCRTTATDILLKYNNQSIRNENPQLIPYYETVLLCGTPPKWSDLADFKVTI